MTQPHHLHEEENEDLVSRYFDEGTTREETAALAALLAGDPAAARSFAETARLHSRLEAASPRTRVRRRGFLNLTRLATAAAAVIAAAAGTVWFIKAGSGGTGINIRVTNNVGKSDLPPPPALARVRRVVRTAPGAQVSPAMTPGEWDALADRWLTNVDPEGKTVREALAALSEEMRANNLLRRPGFDGLAHTVGLSRIPGEAAPRIRYPYPPPYTVTEFLKICGLFQEFSGTPGTARGEKTGAFDAADTVGESGTDRFAVPTDFYSSMRPAPGRPESPDAAHWLLRAGLPLADTESARYSPSTSTLQVTALPAKRARVEEILKIAAGRGGRLQYFVNTRCEVVPNDKLPTGFDAESGMVLNDEELNSYRAASGAREASRETVMPAIIMRPNQGSMAEVTRTLAGGASGWTGYRQVVECGPAGELARVTGHIDIGLPPGVLPERELGSIMSGQTPTEATAAHYLTDFELWLPDRHTGVFALDLPAFPGSTVLAYITVTLIDHEGQPLEKPGVSGNAIGDGDQSNTAPPEAEPLPAGIPVEGSPGFVLSPHARDKGMVDVTGMPPGTKVRCPYTGRFFRTP